MIEPSDRDERSPRDRRAEALRHRFDWETVRPSVAIVEIVAIATDREPAGLEPLYDTVDPEALDRVVRRDGKHGPAGGTNVSFTYAGHDVTVAGDGEVVVTPSRPDGGGG